MSTCVCWWPRALTPGRLPANFARKGPASRQQRGNLSLIARISMPKPCLHRAGFGRTAWQTSRAHFRAKKSLPKGPGCHKTAWETSRAHFHTKIVSPQGPASRQQRGKLRARISLPKKTIFNGMRPSFCNHFPRHYGAGLWPHSGADGRGSLPWRLPRAPGPGYLFLTDVSGSLLQGGT